MSQARRRRFLITAGAVLDRLSGENARIVELPDVRERTRALGADPAARHEVGAGQTASVVPPTVHQVLNPNAGPCRCLLV